MNTGRERAQAWLTTLGEGVTQAFGHDAGMTIMPPDPEGGTDGGRALALLSQIAERDAGGGVELRIGETIGEGGMGVIHAAEQVALARPVAVKTLKAHRREAAIDLLREAWITGSLEHPNVVPVHHLGVDASGSPLIVLKRIAGVEWSQLAIDAAEVARRTGAQDLLAWNLGILLQVLNAVRFAHSRGIVHRDLKPSNVMIGDFGEVYLLDWGIAVSMHDDGSGRLPLARDAQGPAGTPAYMAPEMLGIDETPINERTDVYLAGAVMFELISGRPPHRGIDAATVVAHVIAEDPELPAGVPEELAAICTRALQRDPAARFPSADAMHAALSAYLEHRVSAQIAARAAQRLDDLARVLVSAEREAIYRELAACRAGFQEALAAWRDNRQASDGLVRATVAVAEHELASGDPRAAVRLLGELEEPPRDLLARARAAVAVLGARQQRLEALGMDRDLHIGQRTRWFLIWGFGVGFTLTPLVAQWVPSLQPGTPVKLALFSGIVFVLILLAGIWARDSMRRTAVNRASLYGLMAVFLVQTMFALGAQLAGLTVLQAECLMPLGWTAIAAMGTITIDPAFGVAAAGFAGTFLASCADPHHVFYYLAGGNVIFTVNGAWRWWPAVIAQRQSASSRGASR
ncbi:MAG TPA: serine/threonine-protein kinase [Kofleriaceae bacterium]